MTKSSQSFFPLWEYPTFFSKNNLKKLLRPGEMVLTDPEIEKVSRVLVVDSDF